MPASFPPYSYPDFDPKAKPIEQIGIVESVLQGLTNHGLVSDFATDMSTALDIKRQKVQIQTVASRLWNLGYLKKKIRPSQIIKTFTDTRVIHLAVKRFQRDAAIKADGWVGEHTWFALERLVSFEADFSAQDFFVNNKPLKVMQRAVQLRLFALGLADKRPGYLFRGLKHEDLHPFIRVVNLFHLADKPIPQIMAPETINLLFSQKHMINMLAQRNHPGGENFIIHFSASEKMNYQHRLANRFIVNMAKIELWLLGFDVEINGRNDYSLGDERGDNPKLSKALRRYYKNFEGLNRQQTNKMAHSIRPDFFISLNQTYQKDSIPVGQKMNDEMQSQDASAEVLKRLEDPIKMEEAWNYIQNRGMRLWDGLKRIWQWIKRLGHQVLDFIEENIFRAFFRYASKSFKMISKALNCLVYSLAVYSKGHLPDGGGGKVQILFKGDFDTCIVIHPEAEETHIRKALESMGNLSVAFRISTEMFSHFIWVIINLVTGPAGWARIMTALVRSLTEIKPLYEQIKNLMLCQIH
ncbi:MAG: hypothetical protein HN352_02060 [Bacteroidetes bacterium]|jgi:hypothetical protein|nr:hypothetical protein [Bacteroidota bacterium]MBT3750835.1 hypothetical protein [Bacteroidota bacterium]MBT4398241.1 hypothetical protein [Bacteroidota bacterium]MBT4409026.1 hypothetical protein [Bacteroidota bacterium]MBT7092409.1 hypothetical protein [Bacteroidota bacterium]